MKRKLCKALAIVMTLALAMSLAAVTAFAYDAIDGGTTSFSKNFIVPTDSNIPNVHFDFTIEPGTPVAGGNGNALEILAGPAGATIESATFTNDMTTTDGTPSDSTDTTKKFATDDVVIDLTNVEFTVPGVYRYVITEQATTDFGGITNDASATRYLDVFVFPSEDDASVLEVQTYALRNVASTFVLEDGEYHYDTNPDTKSEGYSNELETVDLEFSKKIEGNQADMTKRFEYTLELSDVNPGVYVLDFVGTAADIVGENNAAVTAENGAYTITVGTDGTYTGTFHLTNGDVVKVLDLNSGYTYSVTENAEDYQSAVGVDNDGTENDYTDPYAGTGITAPITKTGYTNTRTGAIPTGVIITIAPFAIGILVFGAIMLYVVNRRRRVLY